jgi:hypothetical protein
MLNYEAGFLIKLLLLLPEVFFGYIKCVNMHKSCNLNCCWVNAPLINSW